MKRLLFFMLLLIPIGIGACGQVPFKSVCVKGDGPFPLYAVLEHRHS